jgi:hypothetical protein
MRRDESLISRAAARVLGLLALGLLALAGTVALGSRPAHAYPQWQFSSGTTRCNQCHVNPAGGGIVTGYARDAIGDDLSTWQGNGSFAHGVDLPAWLALQVDLRGALLAHDAGNPDGRTLAAFPMQADGQARVSFLDSFSAVVNVGYRGQARTLDTPLGSNNYQAASTSRFISREHYVMWRQSAQGPYLRAGRFFAPYGLRLAEHTTYVRRDLGTNLLDETYGLSGGVVKDDWELHVTGFVPDTLQNTGGQEKGGAALFERRFASMVALGLSGRAGLADDHKRYAGGGFGKVYLAPARTLLMAEADLVNWHPGAAAAVNQLVGYAGLTVFPVKGLWLGAFGEVSQGDVAIKDTATTAIDGQLNWFPYPHAELVILGRLQSAAGQTAAKTLLAQLHYTL